MLLIQTATSFDIRISPVPVSSHCRRISVVQFKKVVLNGYRVSRQIRRPIWPGRRQSRFSTMPRTGYPLACIEASLLSATRTAASAALAAEHVSPNPFEGTLCVTGAGIIARTTIEWLLFRNWKFSKINLYDLDQKEAERFSKWLREQYDLHAVIHHSLESALNDASLVLFTTTTLEPYLSNVKMLEHSPTVLHLSLRDICTNVILASQNIVDDVDHCLKANTSLHLTEMETGNRDFVAGSLVDVLEKKVILDHNKPRIFSPFGLVFLILR